MKLFKKVILPIALSTMLLFTACSSSNDTSAQRTTAEISSTAYVISEVSSATTTSLTEQSSESSEQTTITVSEKTSIVSSGTKPNNEKMYVHFIDVDQGDSIFIELPNSQTMLIDAAEDSQADKIITYIHQQGYESLDYVVETHPHADHMGGMADVINNFNVSNVYLSPATNTTKVYENMLTAIQNSGAMTYSPMAGDIILDNGNLLIEVVAPKEVDNDELNNCSLVIKLTYGDNRFLFTGDAEKSEEDGIWTNIKCDVLKVGHHGSNSSTTANFLKKVEPTYAVISVGVGNSYGHPDNTILKRLADKGVQTFRTDIQGTIVFSSDGTTISVDKSPSEYKAPAETTITTTKQAANTTSDGAYKYVLNTSTMKIHYADCSSTKKIKDENKAYTNDYDKAIADGYKPCGNCHPIA
jgi:competence protein ComEC